MRSTLVSYILMCTGLVLVASGVYLTLHEDVKLGYSTYLILIPHYEFDTMMPGYYTTTRAYTIELASLKQDIEQPVNWVYNINIQWRNCTGGLSIGVAYVARESVFSSDVRQLTLEVHGCEVGTCKLLISDELLARAAEVRPKIIGKYDYKLEKSILEYDYLNISITPVGVVLEEFDAGSLISCSYEFELTAPVLVVKSSSYRPYSIEIPTSVSTKQLRASLALSITGLTAVAIALFLYVARKEPRQL
ncbi:MAG: hypothetical protein QXG17_07745 [Sulfolobales archaeon]